MNRKTWSLKQTIQKAEISVYLDVVIWTEVGQLESAAFSGEWVEKFK